MAIYLDVIWFLNFSFDLLLLLLTAILLKRKIMKLRIIVGALIGSSIVVLLFTPLAPLAMHPFGKLFVSILMVLSAFGFKRFKFFAQSLFTFYFVTFMVGGGMMGAHYFIQTEIGFADGILMTNSGGFGDPVSWLFVLVGFPAAWMFSRKRLDDLEMKKIQYDQIVSVFIKVGDSTIPLKGFIDSGNQLYDPISKSPVMIADAGKLRGFLPDALLNIALQEDVMTALSSSEESHPLENRVRIIPFRVVGKTNQFLIGLKPDEVMITTQDETILVPKAIIGLNRTSLSPEGEYDCIVHPKMLQSGAVQDVS
ncbi:sigma-E processing peptidase SpoIIGA [Metabacillus idriensis]|uniref:Sporulation sigma-E factor-processing peptidase n=1 Tax=Metabacillus idriensis TaxID=324768 RepID=A0A6I2M5V4_9BACI|nr:sigma-E processing peptidase SpoIIGA [Metabacillus idriensis]MCM3594395.1 sigma-E processing peptidase SpoIIGA [Metabacillus idriensis]MRX53575.1 sigma-E processing peptidase SpoIIGA [Metabacillus idriensis]OHR72917.1 sigma-E processing peptidase SpoIIGA [Bacillus sp. HMSC76G11]